MLKGVNHGSVLEHGTVYLTIESYQNKSYPVIRDRYYSNKYSKVNKQNIITDNIEFKEICTLYITTNYRTLVENNWLNDLKYQCEPTEFHEKRLSVKFVLDRGISHEFVRHRIFSFVQESTRYCNYSKDKFGNELTFIIPNWIDMEYYSNNATVNMYKEDYSTQYWHPEDYYFFSLLSAEDSYLNLLEKGWTPQQARSVLPNSLKTELIMTGFASDWEHFFSLRTAQGAHPQAQEIAIPLKQEFKKLGYL
jgi:thymidylate synthase (FAD)